MEYVQSEVRSKCTGCCKFATFAGEETVVFHPVVVFDNEAKGAYYNYCDLRKKEASDGQRGSGPVSVLYRLLVRETHNIYLFYLSTTAAAVRYSLDSTTIPRFVKSASPMGLQLSVMRVQRILCAYSLVPPRQVPPSPGCALWSIGFAGSPKFRSCRKEVGGITHALLPH